MDRTRVEKSAPRRTAAVALLSRLLLAAVVVLTTFTIGVQNRPLFMRDPEHIEVFSGFLERLLEPWANWDGVWFIRIAADGYQAHSFSQAFFPLYPWAVQVVAAVLGGSYVVAGVTISLVCYAGAMAVLYLLASDHFGPRVAMWSVVFISVFPTAFFFQAVYSGIPLPAALTARLLVGVAGALVAGLRGGHAGGADAQQRAAPAAAAGRDVVGAAPWRAAAPSRRVRWDGCLSGETPGSALAGRARSRAGGAGRLHGVPLARVR